MSDNRTIKTTSMLGNTEEDFEATKREAELFGVEVRVILIECGVAEVQLVGSPKAVENYSNATRA